MLTRHKIQIALIALFTFIAFASYTTAWDMWAVIVISLVTLFMADLMFLDESAFVYDPDYHNWRRRTDPRY